ncbi:MAG: glycosyltransferase [Rickettsiales bacterium]|nr:glycosyltransferase [Rickettsiales bacterium]
MTSFNHERFIHDAVHSVLEQGIDSFEILIAEDASNDNTRNICIALQKKYPDNISLILNKNTVGVAKNTSLMQSYVKRSSKYVSLFSGDDKFLPNKLKKQISFMENNPDYVMCYHDVWVYDTNTGKKYRYNDSVIGQAAFSGNIAKKLIENVCFIPAISVLVRNDKKTKHVKYQLNLGVSSDWVYFVELAFLGRVGYIDDVLGVYNRHGSNITRRYPDYNGEEKCYLFFLKEFGTKYEVKKGLIRLYLSYYFKYFLLKDFNECTKLGKKLLSLMFEDYKNILILLKNFCLQFYKRSIFKLKTGSFFR